MQQRRVVPTPATGVTTQKRVVAYIRVSTDQQADSGHSLAAQKERITAYAALYGLDIVSYECDAGLSASTLDRPGLQRALEQLDTFKAEGIIVAKLDRLTRSVRDLADLIDAYFKDNSHALISVGEQVDTMSAAGRLVLNILMSVAQWERETIGERTSAVMQYLQTNNRFTGGYPPFGYRVDAGGDLIEVPAEQARITLARELRAKGHSLRSISGALGLNPRTGSEFSASQIQRML